MTATDQVAADARCVCGCPKWDHKQGRATCKNCGCTTYDPATDPEVEKLRAELDHLREQNHHLREVNVKLGRAEAELRQTQQAIKVFAAERDTRVAEIEALGNELAKVRRQAADLEAALVEANEARRMRDADVRLHQDVARAALVVDTSLAFFCPRCRVRFEFNDLDHRCGPMVPVDVITARRPKEQP